MHRTLRSVAFLTSGVLAVSVLAGCGSGSGDADTSGAAPDTAPAGRDQVAEGGTLNWAVDAMPTTLNAFQADADAATARVAGAVLPALFTLDERGRPQRNEDYLESAEVVETEPKQVVLYKLNQQAVWSDGREIGAPDFVAQWRALSGRDSAYWTARNAGYERIEKIERGANDLEVRVTFNKPYGDWRALFTPLYPKDVMGSPDTFNDGARTKLGSSAGPFRLRAVDAKGGSVSLVRNPRWWGRPAKLDGLVLRAVPRAQRPAALAAGTVDLAEIDRPAAERIALAERDKGAGKALTHGPGAALTPAAALRSWALAHGSDEELAETVQAARARTRKAIATYGSEQRALSGYAVRRSLEPAWTQLALNGESGPLADERVRRAVARALDRAELARTVLVPLGLPAAPVDSHLALAGQDGYADGSEALGSQDTTEARALLSDAGWTTGGARTPAGAAAGGTASPKARAKKVSEEGASDEGTYIVGDDKPGEPRIGGHGPENGTNILAPAPAAALQELAVLQQAESLSRDAADGDDAPRAKAEKKPEKGVAGAYAPRGTAAPGGAAGPLGKDGRPLSLRFVLPSGPGSEALRTVGDKIAQMLDRVGIRTEMVRVSDDSYFKDHVASGEYDLALYSWPGTAYPATDARPIFAKPEPATDGSLLVEQNYTRVGTDRIDQLFAQAASELDEDASRELMREADARIWAAAGSIPLYQRPQLVAAKPSVVNAGAFGFATPIYQDMGFKKKAEAAKK
ncbi:ABC transporter family substrate-binding protein [Streptomyces sp. NPDC001941]|uniref:ABC transporter family substrate-binding protein n=1 Tax=Streptomyces sp. NPDC001941 TaxID=3154659 RepID=UPI0033279687